jgi:hypothetical protein
MKWFILSKKLASHLILLPILINLKQLVSNLLKILFFASTIEHNVVTQQFLFFREIFIGLIMILIISFLQCPSFIYFLSSINILFHDIFNLLKNSSSFNGYVYRNKSSSLKHLSSTNFILQLDLFYVSESIFQFQYLIMVTFLSNKSIG